MSKLLILFLLFALLSCNENTINTINNKQDNNIAGAVLLDTLPVFQIYGELAPADYIDDDNPITEKYGFRVKRVAGCEVDDDILNSVHKNNQRSLKIMNQKYGKNWIQDFENKTKYKLSIPFK